MYVNNDDEYGEESNWSDTQKSNSMSESTIGKMIFFGEKNIENDTVIWSGTASSSPFASYLEEHEGLGDSLQDEILVNDALQNVTDYEINYWPLRDPLYIVIPITVIYVVILITGLLGNVVTCIVIIRSRYLHTATNYYLFSLAISDLLLLLSGLPAEMISIWRRYPDVFGEIFCVGRGLAAETSSNATVLTITAFTIERYLAICRPFVIQKLQNKLSRVVRQILFIWFVSIALAIPQALQFGLKEMPVGPGKTTLICTVTSVVIQHSFEIATFVFFVGPMVLITCLYCAIGLTLRNASRIQEGKVRLRKSLSSHKREVGQQRVLKMLVAVVAAFFICWAPFHSQRLIAIWGERMLGSNETMRKIYHVLTYVSGVLYYLSTSINPVLYSIISLKFRHAFLQMVQILRNACCGNSQSSLSCNSNKL